MRPRSFLIATAVSAALLHGAAFAGETKTDTQSQGTQKDANIDAAQKLNGDTRTSANSKDVQQSNSDIPQGKPIHGFHPIKKALQPLNNLEAMSLKLEQQIMKLEGPIAALQPPMQKLQTGMTGVSERISDTQSRLNGLNTQVTEVRADLKNMQKDIAGLTKPIVDLQGPLNSVSKPLEAVETRLNLIIMAIMGAAALICIGTPLAAIYVYKHRAKLLTAQPPARKEAREGALTH